MPRSDKLFIGVLGNRDAGKSTTWNALFGRDVRTSKRARKLELRRGEYVDAFVISGSPEERRRHIKNLLTDKSCRVVLCSMQYKGKVKETLEYVFENGFWIYLQWLNPGRKDRGETWDKLGLLNRVLDEAGIVSIRSGKHKRARVQEIREFVYGWAAFRQLVYRA